MCSQEKLVVVKGLQARYDRRRPVLRGIDLHISSGELVGLAGPNGSGKTTLLHCITGYHRPCLGVVTVRGQDASRLDRRTMAEAVAFVPQRTESIFTYSVLQMVLMGRHPFSGFAACDSATDIAMAQAALESLQIGFLANRAYTELSGGEQQLVLLARALAQQAPMLVLDEPLTGLDLRHQFQLMSAVRDTSRRSGHAALATFHDLSVAARWCDRLILLHDGHVQADGLPEEVITVENLEAVYGVEAEVLPGYAGKSLFISVSGCASRNSS